LQLTTFYEDIIILNVIAMEGRTLETWRIDEQQL